MDDVSICDVLIELVDRYITEKQKRIHYCSELKKAKELIEHYEEKIVVLSSDSDDGFPHTFRFVDGELVELDSFISENGGEKND